MLLLAVFALSTHNAYACSGGGSGADADSDGWCVDDTPPDCFDGAMFGAFVNPGMEEDGIDPTDNDCDGTPAIFRSYYESFTGITALADWDVGGIAYVESGKAHLPSGGNDLVFREGVSLPSDYGIPWKSGDLFVTVDMELGGRTCGLLVEWHGVGSNFETINLVEGVNVLTDPTIEPLSMVDRMEISCSGTGEAKVDWLTVANGNYEYAGPDDVKVEMHTMGAPGAGRAGFVRANDDFSKLMTGSDVGGFAISYDGIDWYAANGVPGGPLVHSLSDAVAVDDAIFTIGGALDGSGGGLYRTDDDGLSWTQIFVDDVEVAPYNIGASKGFDDCGNSAQKPTSSGHLLIREGDDDFAVVYIANSGEALDIQKPDDDDPDTISRSIDIYELTGGAICEPYEGSLPEDILDSEDGRYFALPSALAQLSTIHYAETDVNVTFDGVDWSNPILVGYRVMESATGDLDDRTTLYLCPSVVENGWDCSMRETPLECMPIDDGDEFTDEEALDVRDIDAFKGVPWSAVIADGGRRDKLENDFTEPEDTAEEPEEIFNSCVQMESSVWLLTLTPDFINHQWTMDLWNTDDNAPGHNKPAWTDGHAYYSTTGGGQYGCYSSDDHSTLGDLVAPVFGDSLDGTANTTSSVVTVAIDPTESWVIASYPGNANRSYGCVTNFRVPVSSIAEEATPWTPIQGWEYGDLAMAGTHNMDRRASIDAGGSWWDDTSIVEAYAPYLVQDALFVPGENEPTNILYSGQALWWYGGADGGFGWDSSPAHAWDTDLDNIPVWEAFDATEDEPVAFQDSGWKSIDVCRGCQVGFGYTRDRVVGALGDLTHGDAYGWNADLSNRRAADRDCHWASGGGGIEVDVWNNPFAIGEFEAEDHQIWHASESQGGKANKPDEGLGRILYFSEDAGATWCFDTMSEGARHNFIKEDAGDTYLMCADYDEGNRWYACKPQDPYGNMVDANVGVPWHIKALDDKFAVMEAQSACLGTNCSTIGGEGLWILDYDGGPAAGITYTPVEVTTDITNTAEFFDTVTDLEVLPALHIRFNEAATVFVLSNRPPGDDDDQMLWQVDIDLDPLNLNGNGEHPATWTAIDMNALFCSIEHDVAHDLAVSPDGGHLLLVGGAGSPLTGSADPGTAGVPNPYYGGGVCIITLGGGLTQPVPMDDNHTALDAVWAHPHLQDVYWYAGYVNLYWSYYTEMDTPGAYVMQHHYSAYDDTWEWRSALVTGDDLELPGIYAMAGGGDETYYPQVRTMYFGSGGGPLEAEVTW